MTARVNGKSNRWLRRLCVVPLAAALLAPTVMPGAVFAESVEVKDKLDEMLQSLKHLHLSAPSEDKLVEAAIEGMIQSLEDPYTEYWTEDEYQQFMGGVDRQFVGLGVVIAEEEGKTRAREVMPGLPGDKAGFRPGDLIETVDGKAVTYEEFNRIKSGWKNGQQVTFGILRDGKQMQLQAILKVVELPLVTGRRIADGVGYVRISSFGEKTNEQLQAELAKLRGNGIRSLVLDLRDNPGGIMTSVRDVAANFIAEGVLVYTRDKDGTEEKVEIKGGRTFPGKIVVLVNERTASAAEILAGALQDHGVARIVGARTYGKGVVQQIYELEANGGYLKITVEEYLTPKRKKVNGVGIEPDLTAEGEGAQVVAALHEAGAGPFALEAGDGVCRIQGVDCGGPAPVMRGGRVFVPVRTLAAVIGANVEWIAETCTVRVSAGGAAADYAADSDDADGFFRLNGTGYADIAAFSERFSQAKLSQNGVVYTLTAG